ncbi:protein misato homolog 1 [Bombina bombina]|uniref:protein misato homolog 1 n=1 Tax=Bombina bombina TaxID=8345 RepID=UPI00235A7F2A|nr:protein misato homolog 1 [Bombina bombina]
MAGMCGEVITFQLGNYANYVGAHWWNLQEAGRSHNSTNGQNSEISSDVLFRRGVTLSGQETYTPRLILVDVKGDLSSLSHQSSLYEDKETRHSTPAWKGNLTTHKEESSTKEQHGKEKRDSFTDEDTGVRTKKEVSGPDYKRKRLRQEANVNSWSDFLRTQLHPKSVCAVSPCHQSGGPEGLESFSQGEALLRESYLDEIEDDLHFFTEECDYLQGFQILCDLHSGFSGVGAKVAELLHDEFPRRGIMSWGTLPVNSERDQNKDMYRLMNCILGLVRISSQSSLFCPMSLNSSLGRKHGPPIVLPHLSYNAEAYYQSSALLAATLDTLTLPYRKPSSIHSMLHLADTLNFCERKVVSASTSFPFPLGPYDSLADALMPHMTSAPWISMSGCGIEDNSFSNSVVLRGISKEQQSSYLPAGTKPVSALHVCDTGEDILRGYLNMLYPKTSSISHVLQDMCRLGPTFPQLFSPYVTKEGFTLHEPMNTLTDVVSVPVLATLQTATALHHSLCELYDDIKKVDIRRWPSFFTSGLEHEEFNEAMQDLRSLAQCYREGDRTEDESD